MNELEQRLYNGSQDFTQNELRDLVFEYEYDEVENDEGRWTRDIETIIKVKDKLFCIDWKRGLTEYQEHSFNYQPYEVKEQIKTIEVKEYIKEQIKTIEVKRLLKIAYEIAENQQIQSAEKEMAENIIRLDFLTGAYEMCLILEKENIAKELKKVINQISDKL